MEVSLQQRTRHLAELLLMVAIIAIQSDTLFAASAKSFGDRLFEASLPFANQSLHGQFISEMVAGTLPKETFESYLYQDNLYLSKYARAFAVLGARAQRTDELVWLLNQSVNYVHEHGPDANAALEEEVFQRDSQPVTVAYTSFFLQAAWGENPILSYASLLPCQRLYDWLFSTIKATRHIADDNPYKAYIDQYADPSNHDTTKKMESYLERYVAQGITQEQATRAQYNYDTAMKYEAQFFQQAFSSGARSQQNAQRSLSDENVNRKLEKQSFVREQELFDVHTVGYDKFTSWPTAVFVVLGIAIPAYMAVVVGVCLLRFKLPGATDQTVSRSGFLLLNAEVTE